MKSELFHMYRYASMIKSVAFCAATFAFLSVVFKNSIVLVPEVTEVRLCNILACCYGIWFGPAGAWGCAIGNLVGDMGGSLTWLSIFGFTGNFVSAWIPYKLWGILGSGLGENQLDRPTTKSKKWALRYLVCSLVSVVCCAVVLAVPFDLSHSLPADNTFRLIFLNNFGAAVVGILLFVIMSNIPNSVLPYWREMMTEERELAFVSGHRMKAIIMIIVAIAATLFYFIYLGINNIDITGMDEFGKILPVSVGAVTAITLMVVTAMCQWNGKENQVRSLD